MESVCTQMTWITLVGVLALRLRVAPAVNELCSFCRWIQQQWSCRWKGRAEWRWHRKISGRDVFHVYLFRFFQVLKTECISVLLPGVAPKCFWSSSFFSAADSISRRALYQCHFDVFCPLCLHFLPTFVWDLLLSAPWVQPRSVPQCPCPFLTGKLSTAKPGSSSAWRTGLPSPGVPRDETGAVAGCAECRPRGPARIQPDGVRSGTPERLQERQTSNSAAPGPLGFADNPVGHRVAVTWGAGP